MEKIIEKIKLLLKDADTLNICMKCEVPFNDNYGSNYCEGCYFSSLNKYTPKKDVK